MKDNNMIVPCHICLIFLDPSSYVKIINRYGDAIFIERPTNRNYDKHFWVYESEVEKYRQAWESGEHHRDVKDLLKKENVGATLTTIKGV